ncbi:DUF898 family protein [Sulfitobacter albidus]|uniref:DUF898 family protein n=1 Tax=Sulfitobacter albidus TaxID=2829501 RepID=A0A975JGI1_9RHOB|nr:DUF898 family protein [Sulfitobacter albidus]
MPAAGLSVYFTGNRSALFWLALKTGFWSILTLGFYRFWMKTRLRRWYWSAIRPGGHPLEYVGDPWEKLLGFFIAVVILTFYIGIVNLALMFVSFSVFQSAFIGYAGSFIGVVPLWFYAQYRARRYVLGRTRWRSVRFGLEPGAWGYAWRALVHWVLTLCTLGVLWPRMTFWLEKYKTDRTFFGSAHLRQEGRWQMLIPATWPFVAALLATGLWALWVIYFAPVYPGGDASLDTLLEQFDPLTADPAFFVALNAPGRLFLALPLLAALIYGAVHYRFVSKRILANHKSALGVRLRSTLKGLRVSMIYTLGTTLAYLSLVFGLILVVFLGLGLIGFDTFLESQVNGADPLAALPRWLSIAVVAVLYLGVFLLWNVLHHTFVTYPLMRHMAVTLSLENVAGLAGVSQVARDEFAEAEGFAEALDLGAAI